MKLVIKGYGHIDDTIKVIADNIYHCAQKNIIIMAHKTGDWNKKVKITVIVEEIK